MTEKTKTYTILRSSPDDVHKGKILKFIGKTPYFDNEEGTPIIDTDDGDKYDTQSTYKNQQVWKFKFYSGRIEVGEIYTDLVDYEVIDAKPEEAGPDPGTGTAGGN